jgi:dipeptidase
MNRFRFPLSILLVLFLSAVASGQGVSGSTPAQEGHYGCFSIVVGREASADGYVIMAHNEDDSPPVIVNHYKIERKKYARGEKVRLLAGGELAQAEVTWAYIWSEMPGLLFSDSYVNEWGVCVASDQCPSREDRPVLTEGGISYMLRRLVAERATTARRGVRLAGELVHQFGYDSSGRTYIISDPDEGWFFCVVHGKHWLAARVPDDEVAMVANTYSVRRVDLADSANFLASPDIVDYAVSRGWYDSRRDGEFDFASVYSDPEAASDLSNIGRQWAGLRYLTDSVEFGQDLPFSVKPNRKLDVPAVIEILRDHYEGTELYESSLTGCPHERSFKPICGHTTQTSFVVQLRRDRPLDIGIVYWVCLGSPCVSFYHPFHFGVSRFPDGWSVSLGMPSEASYRAWVESVFHADPLHAFWTCSNFRHKVESRYGDRITRVTAEIVEVERRAFSLQKPVEDAALLVYPTDRERAVEILSNYSSGLYLSAMEAMERALSER